MLSKRFFKTMPEVEVTFQHEGNGYNEAFLVCEATGWEATPMRRTGRGRGPFTTKLRLPRGQAFEFRYLLDGGVWENEWEADAYTPNPFGSENSVVSTAG